MFNHPALFHIFAFGGFFLGSKSSSICGCKNILRSVCVGPSDPVFVPCPALKKSEDFTLQLLKNQTPISAAICTQSSCGPSPESSGTNQNTTNLGPAVSLTNQSSQLGFNVTVRDWSSHGLYICEGLSKYPPPVQKESGPEQVLVLVQGHQCDLKQEDPRPDPIQYLVWIIVVVCLSSYSLLVSIICALLWVKLRSAECERDYVNTKPGPIRHRRKKPIHVVT